MGVKLITAAAVEPIGLQELKDHLHVDLDDDDATIDVLIATARRKVEDHIWRQLITATYDQTWDVFPPTIRPDKPPMQSVTSIKYIDGAGAEQTLATTEYKIDTISDPGRIVPAFGKFWPTTRSEINAVTVQFVAGFGDAGGLVPGPLTHAILLLSAHWYDHREAVAHGQTVMVVPQTVMFLIEPWIYRAGL